MKIYKHRNQKVYKVPVTFSFFQHLKAICTFNTIKKLEVSISSGKKVVPRQKHHTAPKNAL